MRRKLLLLLIIGFVLWSTNLFAIPTDLSTFDLKDSSVIFSGINNSSATIYEDQITAPIALLDYDFPIPTDAMSLTFSYLLNVPNGNEDYFDFYFDDLSGPSNSFGGFKGIYSGSITKDLTGFAGGTLALAFALYYGWDDEGLDSVLTISNVQINPIPEPGIPEPGTFILIATGLLGLPIVRKKIQSKKQTKNI